MQAGKEWLKSFMNRSANLSIHKREATSLGQATSFNEHNVHTFLKNLNKNLPANKIQPRRIWNMDIGSRRQEGQAAWTGDLCSTRCPSHGSILCQLFRSKHSPDFNMAKEN